MADDEVKRRRAEKLREWKKVNREKVNAMNAKWRAENREKCAAMAVSWRLRNAERHKETSARFREKYKERAAKLEAARKAADPIGFRAYNAKKAIAHYHRNREACIARSREYQAKNRDKINEINKAARAKRRAQKLASEGTFSGRELTKLRAKAGKKCTYCGVPGKMTVDHIKPLARGGANVIRNIQFVCAQCNSSKGARDPIEFANSLGLLV